MSFPNHSGYNQDNKTTKKLNVDSWEKGTLIGY
jgi:hypothetical protein